MSTENLVSYDLGETAASGELEHLLGSPGQFADVDKSGASGADKKLSGMIVHAIWVKNESGGALTAGTLVAWDTGTTYGPGQAVIAANGADVPPCGVVDHHLPTAGVADNEHFWMIVKGPTKVRALASVAVTVRGALIGGASGRAGPYTSGTDEIDSIFGIALEADTSTTVDQLINCIVECHVYNNSTA